MTEAHARLRAAWLDAAESRAVLAALQADGKPARFVGGCVRDALLDPERDAADLDLATPETPTRVMTLLTRAGIRVVPTGLKHGTVTALAGRHVYEVTTLRRDVACFGRHAQVEFTDDFAVDAARRDFTINAISCDGEGRLFDPFGGIADLRQGRVRFVGAARQRIDEDHLRILRFFRFQARFGRGVPDAEALATCAEGAKLVDRLSGERVRGELFRLLVLPEPTSALTLMRDAGVLAHVVPWPADLAALERLIHAWPDADALLRLAALGRPAVPDAGAVDRLALRLRLSRAETERLRLLLLTALPDPAAPAAARRRAIFDLGAATYADLVRLAHAVDRARREAVEASLALAASWRPPVFPLRGEDVTERGVPPGPAVGRLLASVAATWADRDFVDDREACLRRLDELLAADLPQA